MYIIKYRLLVSFYSLFVLFGKAQILTTSNSSSLTIRSGTIFSAGGLTLVPEDHFTIKEGNGIYKDTIVAHPANKAIIDRAYFFTKVTNEYKGMIHFSYHDSELNGLNESGLELHIHDGVNWKHHNASKHDHQQNIHSTSVAGINLTKLTLVGRQNLMTKREPLPVHVLTNPIPAGYISLLVDKDCELILINSSGQLVDQQKLSRGWHSWDISHLPKGSYYLRDVKGLDTAVPIVYH